MSCLQCTNVEKCFLTETITMLVRMFSKQIFHGASHRFYSQLAHQSCLVSHHSSANHRQSCILHHWSSTRHHQSSLLHYHFCVVNLQSSATHRQSSIVPLVPSSTTPILSSLYNASPVLCSAQPVRRQSSAQYYQSSELPGMSGEPSLLSSAPFHPVSMAYYTDEYFQRDFDLQHQDL